MKKIVALIVTGLVLFSGSAKAQNLGNILNSISNVVNSVTGNTRAVKLPGDWTYTGAAVALGGENAVSNIAGAAARTTVESKVDEYLSKLGLSTGAMQFSFKEDGTFVCTTKGIPVNGTWKMSEDGKTVKLQFSKTLKKLALNGTVNPTPSGCEMLFDSSKFLKFMKTILAYAAKQNATAGAVASLAENYDNMKLGFKLARD